MKSLHFITTLLLLAACQSQPATSTQESSNQINLDEVTITQLRQGYNEKKYTIANVVNAYLQRIDDIDKKGPALNSIIYLNPDALKQAEALDKEMADGKIRSPLHGIPVILKDNIDTHDMPTTAGATVLQNSFPLKDSWVTKKLIEAGAVILGKANLSEWANFRGNMSSSGWSGVGGQTKNPYVLDRNPCGSSSGSGVVVAANLCILAIGTETNGSIVCPSNNNGIVGLKPTVGLISRSGIIPISFTQDTPGPMCRTVEDIAISLGILTGVDSADSKTLNPAGVFLTNYTKFLKADGLKGKRIGVIKGSANFHVKVDSLFTRAIAFMKNQGAEIIEVQVSTEKIEDNSFTVMLYEFKDGLNSYFKNLGEKAPVKNLEELITFNKKDSIELRYFDQELLVMAQAKGDLKSKEYTDALSHMLSATRDHGIDKVMNDNHLDALIAPTGSPAWKTDHLNGDHYIGGSSSLAAIAGYPSIAVPMGFIGDLPVDISFFGKAWSEGLLIEIAYAYEQGTKHRQAPKYLVTD